jgi:lysophospholipase L1-like esterase
MNAHVIRHGLLGAAVAVLAGVGVGTAANGHPVATDTPSSSEVLMVGDSLTVGAQEYLRRDLASAGWGEIEIDAASGRSVRMGFYGSPESGLKAVDDLRGATADSDNWIVALGTNDVAVYDPAQYRSILEEMLDKIGTGHRVLWINVYLPNDAVRSALWNEALASYAAADPHGLLVADWASYASQHREWLSADGIHYTDDGYQARSAWIAEQSLVLAVTPAPAITATTSVDTPTSATAPIGPGVRWDTSRSVAGPSRSACSIELGDALTRGRLRPTNSSTDDHQGGTATWVSATPAKFRLQTIDPCCRAP